MRDTKGITLIALIITIILLLILVAVTVTTAIQSGLFGHAGKATKQWAEEQEKEANIGNDNQIRDTVNEYIGTAIPGNRVTENTKYESDGKIATIPAGFTPSGVKEEQSIDNGLVIYLIPEGETIDWTNPEEVKNAQKEYDQFVWIPIADINDMYMCQSEEGTKSCKITVEKGKAKCTTHNSEQMAGRLYATNEGETFTPTLTTQTYTANAGLREPDIIASYDSNVSYLANINNILGTSYTADNFKQGLQEEYNEIVKSVCENHGFYVGRYETSNLSTTDGTSAKVVAGATPSNHMNWYYMYAQQRDYANNNSLDLGSSMIQGAAYDQVMKFINTASYDVTTAGNVGHNFSNIYQTGGRDYIGTYNDTSKNIFDLEGNVSAWTTEVNLNKGRASRGGEYSDDYGVGSASCRSNGLPYYDTSNYIGTVLQIYVK